MNHDNYDEKKITKMLSNLPRIQDKQDKEQVYAKIMTEFNSDQHRVKSKKQKFPWVIPSLASVAVVILLMVIFQDTLPNNNYSSTSDNGSEASMSANEESSRMMDQAPFANEDSVGDSTMQGEESVAKEQIEANMFQADINITNYVVYNTNPNVSIIPVAAMDSNIQHVVPLTLVDRTDGNRDPEYFYNSLASFIDEEELGVQVFPFDGITFDLAQDQKQVLLDIPNSYQLEEGAAIGGMFEKILATMFTPYNINTAVLDPNNTREEPFGLYGNVDSLPLNGPKNQGFKLYQGSQTNTTLLVPTSNNQFETIEEAVLNMKQDQPAFNLQATIQNEVQLDIETNEKVVTISSSSSTLANNQETVIMIEAILLTAKSFGYASVKFDLPITAAGSYQLQGAIPVPDGANPIFIE